MWPRFGIKIGNSSLCIASIKADGKIEVIANKQGDRVSQACLFAEKNEIECGLTAKQKATQKATQTIRNSFQFLLPLLTKDKIATAVKEIDCEYDEINHHFKLKSKCPSTNSTTEIAQLSPFDVCVHLYKTELELARGALGDNDAIPIAVISIPHYYPNESWHNLASAAEKAGFNIVQVVAEPTAAVLAYGIGEEAESDSQECKFVLCIKSGGLFSDFTLYEVINGFYSVIDSAGPYSFGGKLFTEALVEYVAQEFHRKYKLDPKENRRSIAKIRNAAINCKHILTTLPSTKIYIDSLMDGIDFNLQMSRARFESLIQPIINNFMSTLDEVIARFLKNHENVKIDEIVLLGGTMQIPKLQAVIENRFPDAKMNTSYSADEVVAIGCARQASLLIDPNNQDITRKKQCFFTDSDFIIWHGDDDENARIIFKKGTIVPSVNVIEVPTCAKTPIADTFHIKIKDDVQKICLTDIGEPIGGSFKIEAEISSSEENSLLPIVELRCL